MKESMGQIEEKLKKIFTFKRMNPHIYWRNILLGFFVIIIALIIFSLYLLSEIKNQQLFQTPTNTEKKTSLMNDKLLNKITESFNTKQAREKELRNGSVYYKDPSGN